MFILQSTLLVAKKDMSLARTFVVLVTCTLLLLVCFFYLLQQFGQRKPIYKSVQHTKTNNESDKWSSVPDFQLYIRLSSRGDWVAELQVWFIKSFRLFWPHQRSDKLVLVFDAENKQDHKAGNMLSNIWPYPKICYREPHNPAIYLSNQRYRMFWDFFYPDSCITAEYVAFGDTDTVLISVVTPGSLFQNRKAIVLPRIGMFFIECWSKATEYILGFKEALQCMSYFPVILKVQHIVELREFVAKRFGKSFDDAFMETMQKTDGCLCQFSVMCNYVWYKHRDEYQFHASLQPDDKWDGKSNLRDSMVTSNYTKQEIMPKYSLPKPRIAGHGGYMIPYGNGKRLIPELRRLNMQSPHGVATINGIIRKGICFGGGFNVCPQNCRHLDRHALFEDLFVFEWIDWLWDHRCLEQQKIYLQEVKELVAYNQAHNIPIFGVSNIEDICSQF